MNTHASAQLPLPLEAPQPDDRTFLNDSVWFVDSDGYRVVFRWHEPLYRVALTDEVHLRMVAVALRQSRLATQQEICRAFGHSIATQTRWERLSVDEATIRRTLKRLGLRRKPDTSERMLPHIEEQAAGEHRVAEIADAQPSAPVAVLETAASPADTCLPTATVAKAKITTLEEEAASASSFTLDRDPRDRSGDRVLARLGWLDDAVPLFADHECLPRAGALLAVPLLVGHGLIQGFVKVYGSLHPSFYGLRTIVVTLFLAALLRIKRPEHFKEYLPQDLGAILGLDRAPEVKTVRRKFAQLAAMGRAKLLMDELARQRIARDPDRVAFLYLDGHVREYHGKFPLFRAKKAQRQVVTPAATDTWVHDAHGEPLLVVTSEMNAKLTQVLEPILADVRRLVSDGRRMTVIFDRGGFSPKLFARLIDAGFDVITYRKGKVEKLPAEKPGKGKRAKGRKRYLWMREVRVLREDGRQTSILTNRQDLSAVTVPYRMFDRWRQENYFKYAEEEFALDALVEYGVEELPEATDRRNPEWLRLTRRWKEARAEVARLQGELGKEAAANQEAARPTMRGFKIAHAGLREQLQRAEARVQRLSEQRRKTPQRVPASDRKTLKPEKKLIADAIQMAAYQVETELLGMLQDHYERADDEGRTLLHAAFQSPARLEVAERELRVTIAAQSSPHRTAALAALCERLDALAIQFPGTHLRLRLAVQAAEPIIS